MMDTIRLIIECTMDEEKRKLIESVCTVQNYLPMINSYIVEAPSDALSKLRGIEGIKTVYQNACITAQMNAARKAVKADIAQSAGYTGHGVGIAILDTGISPVDDLTKPMNRIAVFKDVINGKRVPYDDNGHGTHVACLSSYHISMFNMR